MNQLSGWTRRSALALTGTGLTALGTRGLAAGPEPHFEVMADGLGF